MDLDLDGRCFAVTGGSRGLGFATASALVSEGARVVLAGRDQGRLDAACALLGPAASGVVGNLADMDLAERMLAQARGLDGALISVGGPPAGSVLTTTDEQWESAFGSVFLGAVRFARTLCPNLAPGSAISFVLSTSARQVFPGITISNGLRPGLAMLVKDLADEVGPAGIRVVGLLPGRIATDRIAELEATSPDPVATRKAASALIPLGRYGTPDEFGNVAAFMLSPRASYLTGTLITIDGGSTRSP